MHPLVRLQGGLEDLYRVQTGVDVLDFVIDADSRDALAPTRRPMEQLLVCEDGDEVSLGLFVDDATLSALATTLAPGRPRGGLSGDNFGHFLLALEGVSHFVYATVCAQSQRSLSALELELQAEVDKYVTSVLTVGVDASAVLRARLFHEVAYEIDLDDDEHDRYRAANDNAHRYAQHLESTYLERGRVTEMLRELRSFYRQPLARKLEVIAKAA